jgi:hypothetical protein
MNNIAKNTQIVVLFILLVSAIQSSASTMTVWVEADQIISMIDNQDGNNLLVPLHIPEEINNVRIEGVYLNSNLIISPVSDSANQDELLLLMASLSDDAGIINGEVQPGSYMTGSQGSGEVVFDVTNATRFIAENNLNDRWILIHCFEGALEAYNIELPEDTLQLGFEFYYSLYSE